MTTYIEADVKCPYCQMKQKSTVEVIYGNGVTFEMGDVFVLAIFQPPSKNDFLIRAPLDKKVQSMINAGEDVFLHDY